MARTWTIIPETKANRWKHHDFFTLLACGYALYRLFDSECGLLYVGVTGNPVERWRSHAQRKSWWVDVDEIRFEIYRENWQALDAEREAIRNEQPAHNIRSAPRGGR